MDISATRASRGGTPCERPLPCVRGLMGSVRRRLYPIARAGVTWRPRIEELGRTRGEQPRIDPLGEKPQVPPAAEARRTEGPVADRVINRSGAAPGALRRFVDPEPF